MPVQLILTRAPRTEIYRYYRHCRLKAHSVECRYAALITFLESRNDTFGPRAPLESFSTPSLKNSDLAVV